MAAVAQRSMPLQTGTAQICARPDPLQQALIVCPPGFQGKGQLHQILACCFLQLLLEMSFLSAGHMAGRRAGLVNQSSEVVADGGGCVGRVSCRPL